MTSQRPPGKPESPSELASLRVQIDAVDDQILALLDQRARWSCKRVGEIKRERRETFPRPAA